MDKNKPFFVIGSGRTGTTLLRLILCGHSRLHVPPETWFITDLVQRFPLDAPLTRDQLNAAVNVMVNHYRWPDMGIADDDLRTQAAALDAPRLVDLIDLPYREHLRRAGKPRFGDKTPPYIGIVAELMALYPQARFINMIRDGRDVAISFVEAHLKSRAYHRDFEWSGAVRLAEQLRASPYASRILDVRYEDLVRDPEPTVRQICAFLGEEFEPQMMAYRERVALVPQRERAIHGKLDRPINSDAIAVWRQKLTGLECFMLEALLGRELDQLGYARRFAAPALRPLQAATASALRALGPTLDRVLPALQRRGMLPRAVYL